MSQPALSGPIHVQDDRDELKRENARLKRENDDLHLEVQKAKNESRNALRAMAALRDALSPTFRGLKLVFGELESVDLPEAVAPGIASAAPRTSAGMFEGIKARVSPKQAELIGAIEVAGAMTMTQLQAFTGGRISTIKDSIYKLRDMGIVVRNGEKWALKAQ